MADQRLSQLDQAALPLSGAELAYVVQSGAQKRTTTAALAALASPTDLAYDPATRILSSSTGADVTLPLATTASDGLMSAADKALVGEAFRVTVMVHNRSGATIPKGSACYEVGSSGDLPTVALASASGEATSSKTLGLALEPIPNNADGKVLTLGRLEGIDTSGLTEGATVWLGTSPGSLTTTRPTQPAHGVVLGLVVRSGSGGSGILFVRVANGQELEELHDVLITGSAPAAGAPRPVLAWSTDGLWRDVLLGPSDVGADEAGAAAAAVAAHTAAADPHSQYTTVAEAAAAAPVQSVAGKIGAVTLAPSDVGAQPVDSDLTAIAELTTTAFGRGLLTVADGPAARTAIDAASTATFSSSQAGLVPASGGGTENFLRADGAFAAPPSSAASVYAAGNWICPPVGLIASGISLTAGRIVFTPFCVLRRISISDLGARVSSAAAGGNAQLAIYANHNGEPIGAPLATTVSVSTGTATTVEATVTTFTLEANTLYWAAVLSNATPSFTSLIDSATYNASVLGASSLGSLVTGATSIGSAREMAGQSLSSWPTLTAGQTTESASPARRGAIVFLRISALL